jgi:hypothetical protein
MLQSSIYLSLDLTTQLVQVIVLNSAGQIWWNGSHKLVIQDSEWSLTSGFDSLCSHQYCTPFFFVRQILLYLCFVASPSLFSAFSESWLMMYYASASGLAPRYPLFTGPPWLANETQGRSCIHSHHSDSLTFKCETNTVRVYPRLVFVLYYCPISFSIN